MPIFVYKVTTEFVKCVKYACSNHFYLSSTMKLTGSKWTKQIFGRKKSSAWNYRQFIQGSKYFKFEIFEINRFIFESIQKRNTYYVSPTWFLILIYQNWQKLNKNTASTMTLLTDTGENVQKWTRVFPTRCWVILVARTRPKKRE